MASAILISTATPSPTSTTTTPTPPPTTTTTTTTTPTTSVITITDPSLPLSDTSRASPDFSAHGFPQQYDPNRPGLPSILTPSARPRALSTVPSSSPVKRKPLPSTASPLVTKYSSLDSVPSTAESRFSRPVSVDSPTLYDNPLPSARLCVDVDRKSKYRTSNELVALTSPPATVAQTETKETDTLTDTSKTPSSNTFVVPVSGPHHESLTGHSVQSSASASTGTWYDEFTPSEASPMTMSIFSTRPTPPHLNLPDNVASRDFSNGTSFNNSSKTTPKSPGASKLGSFFGWGDSASPASSTTTFSDERTYSPAQSPVSPKKSPLKSPSKMAGAKDDGYFADAYRIPPPTTPATTIQVEEMEDELKAITAELATSIRREMELEDLVERLQSEAANPHGPGKRTSDYFSDSGASSVRYGVEPEARNDELERLQRKAEREKAQIRIELTDRVQDERTRRKALEAQIRILEGKASQVDLASISSLDANGRLRELETTCEDLRRRLSEERTVKENFEDLLAALKDELQSSHNERDNLRDEIVPQLRARVEGLEAQAAEHEKLAYEHTKMQQEMQMLRNENVALTSARRLQTEMQQQIGRFNSIDEEAAPAKSRASVGLSRSNSVAQSSGIQRSVRPPSLTRSASVKAGESREVLAERLRDVELQRDALHRALKSLLERQDYYNRENEKRVRQLETERDHAVSKSPRRLGYDREVRSLREEINTLRRRADEAIEQKWQCEKGLSGLKMDLERAEQETSSLKSLLQENEIAIPDESGNSNGGKPRSNSATSEALERAYRELQKSYAESLDRVRELEDAGPKDEAALASLQQSLSEAISERDFARREAEAYRQTADSLHSTEREHIASEISLAEELRASTKRVEELATQVQQQLAANATLRQRLTETIDRGEKEQKSNASRIMHMQGKLRSLEDALMAAQQASEEHVTKHEEEIRELKKSHSAQLLRARDGLKTPRLFSPKSPLSPLFAGARSPRLDITTSGKAMSIGEESKTEFLKKRVVELEKALEEADKEMEEVVGKMNTAQVEVMELQNEREEAVRQTRRLQAMIEEERLKSFRERFASLSS